MWGTYVTDDRDRFDYKQKVGVIVNYFSEQILKRDYQLYNLIPINHEKIIKQYNLKKVFVDGDFLTSTHPWRDFRLEDIINQLKKLNLEIYIINNNKFNNLDHPEVKYIRFENDKENKEKNEIILPPLINEKLLNPISSDISHELLILSTHGSINSTMETSIFKNLTVKNFSYANINKKNTVKLIDFIKSSRVIYVEYSQNFDTSVLKYIELFATSLNTLIIFDPIYQYNSDYNLNIDDIDNVEEYIIELINESFLYRKEIIPRNRNVLLDNSLIIKNKFSEINKSIDFKNTEPKVGLYIKINSYMQFKEFLVQLNEQISVDLKVIAHLESFEISKEEIENIKSISRFDIQIIFSAFEKNDKLIKDFFDNSKYFLKISGEVSISSYFVLDQVMSLEYSDADLAGKSGHMVYLKEENFTVVRNWDNINKFSENVIQNIFITKLDLINEYLHQRKIENFEESLLKRFKKDNKKIYISNNNGFYIIKNSMKDLLSSEKDFTFYCYGRPIEFE